MKVNFFIAIKFTQVRNELQLHVLFYDKLWCFCFGAADNERHGCYSLLCLFHDRVQRGFSLLMLFSAKTLNSRKKATVLF